MSAAQFVILAGIAVLAAALIWLSKGGLSGRHKRALKNSVDHVFAFFERRRLIMPLSSFSRNYESVYAGLASLEENYDLVRQECENLLKTKEQLPDIEKLGGDYTAGGVHAVKWKSFVFKWGDFVQENCQRCPETARLLKQIPDAINALFSVLEPQQYIKPHCGYYKGFLRYHLGVVIPNNNADQKCYIRVSSRDWNNSQPLSYEEGTRILSEDSSIHYWKNGEGILFDDTRLHDAENASNEVRVVLILDMRRKMPWLLDLFNRICLYIGYSDGSIKRIKANAIADR